MSRIIVVLALLLGLAACGTDENDAGFSGGVDGGDAPLADSGDDEEPLDDPAGADDDLVDSIEAYARTQVDADPDALLQFRSEGCAQVDTDLDTGDVEGGASADDVSVSEVDADVDGDEATVSYRLDPAGEMVTDERWVREDGEWKWDNC
jgi:hypothetical protein